MMSNFSLNEKFSASALTNNRFGDFLFHFLATLIAVVAVSAPITNPDLPTF